VADVLFPRLSQKEAVEGVLATWFVSDGDQVASGQLLGEVMADKVSAEVVSSSSGQVRLLVSEGQTVRQGAVIAQVE
jgi:pyruvate/2-oxoglutarate dehydrogenase complex dihydrolipoamide acyltransferase (E2) component